MWWVGSQVEDLSSGLVLSYLATPDNKQLMTGFISMHLCVWSAGSGAHMCAFMYNKSQPSHVIIFLKDYEPHDQERVFVKLCVGI